MITIVLRYRLDALLAESGFPPPAIDLCCRQHHNLLEMPLDINAPLSVGTPGQRGPTVPLDAGQAADATAKATILANLLCERCLPPDQGGRPPEATG